MELANGEKLSVSTIRHITFAMWRVREQTGYMRDEGQTAMNFWKMVQPRWDVPGLVVRPAREAPDLEIPPAWLPPFADFLRKYLRTANELRTKINPVIGANIQRNIDRYPDHVHLITCGDAHVIHNPLYQFIRLPPGHFGIVDQGK